MKLQQLRYIVEVANNDLNVSLAAEKLYTSQPGVSKQIKLLEDELGVQIFARSGKHLSDITPIGNEIIMLSRDILNKTHDIKELAIEHSRPNQGSLSIATTYTQARYTLPSVIQTVINEYPDITLNMMQNSSSLCLQHVQRGQVDFAIIEDLQGLDETLIALPCYHWNYVIIVMKDHPLTHLQPISIDELANYPLISYDFSKEGADLLKAFIKVDKQPNIVFNTTDEELIKTYVKLGMGVGIVAKMSIHDLNDRDLTVLNAGHIFSYNTTYLVFSRALFLRRYMYQFINQFAPHLDKILINRALSCNNGDVLTMFNGVKLPVK